MKEISQFQVFSHYFQMGNPEKSNVKQKFS